MLTCVVCNTEFERPGKHGPVPKYCSNACRQRKQRERPERREYERNYARTPKAKIRKANYGWRYNRRPEVRARNRDRMRAKWHNDSEWREKQLERLRNIIRKRAPQVPIPAPYSGHRWLDMVRNMVAPMVDGSTPWADDYYDDMGEGLLALLEGRDPKQAIKDYRKQEFMSRHMTYRIGDLRSDEGDESNWFERVMPSTPSAEDEYLSAAFDWNERGYRFDDVSTRRGKMHHRTQQPSERRKRNK